MRTIAANVLQKRFESQVGPRMRLGEAISPVTDHNAHRVAGRNRSVLMIGLTWDPPSEMRRSLARWNLEVQRIRSPILRYGFTVVSVAIGLGLALIFQHYGVQNVESPPFSLALVLTAWYAGIGPSVVAVVLSATCFNYFFTEPLYSFEITNE